MPNDPTIAGDRGAPDLTRRSIFRIAVATAGVAAAMYIAPVVVRQPRKQEAATKTVPTQ